MRARPAAPLLGVLLLAVGPVAACGDGGTDAALAALDDSRAQVRALATELRERGVDALDGEVERQVGGWESCVTAASEVGAEFRYSAQVLLRTGPTGARLVDRAGELVAEAGLRRTTGPTDEVRATAQDLEVALWALPPAATGAGYAEGDLLVTVAGPCLTPPGSAVDDFAERVGPDEPLR